MASTVGLSESQVAGLRREFPEIEIASFARSREAGATLEEAEILVTYGFDLPAARLPHLPRLRWVQVCSAGVDRLPLADLARRQVKVTNVRGIHGIPIAEHVLALMLAFARRLPTLWRWQQQKYWTREMGFSWFAEITGRRLTVVGTGAIGREVVRKAAAFGLHVWGVNTSGHPVDDVEKVWSVSQLSRPLAESDYVVLALPLTRETSHLVGEKELQAMPPASFLINVGRGGLVDTPALVRALREGWIAGAGLDVLEEEPLPADSPLWEMENVIITPHVAGWSAAYLDRCLEILRANLRAYLGGEGGMLNLVDASRGY